MLNGYWDFKADKFDPMALEMGGGRVKEADSFWRNASIFGFECVQSELATGYGDAERCERGWIYPIMRYISRVE